MSTKWTNLQRAVAAINDEIRAISSRVAGEQSHPGLSVDQSDDVIRDGKRALADLRRIRHELEELDTGVVL